MTPRTGEVNCIPPSVGAVGRRGCFVASGDGELQYVVAIKGHTRVDRLRSCLGLHLSTLTRRRVAIWSTNGLTVVD